MMVFEYAPNGNLFEHLHGNNFHLSLKAQVITLRIANPTKGLSSLCKKQNAEFVYICSLQLRKLNLLTGAQG